jgi:LPS-assembly protein
MRETPRALPVCLLAAWMVSNPGHSAEPAGPALLEPSTVLSPPPRGDAARLLPIVLQAREIGGQPGLETTAQGDVEFRRGRLVIRADRLAYDAPLDLATAKGQVRVVREGAVYTGPELALKVQRFEGYFLQPEFEFPRLGAGGRADRLDFLGDARSRATNAQYTSCPRDGDAEPAWVLKAKSVSLDLDTNVGVAEGAVLRFLGLPILALPSLSFPLGDQRRSGWLPPSVNFDNRGGLELGVPYYWDIAPNRDATIAPRLITRRGMALDGEFRYFEPAYQGSLALEWLPDDRVARRARESLQWTHEGQLGAATRYSADLVRVSDDDWWKDFRSAGNSLTTRLLPLRLGVERSFSLGPAQGLAYARALQWQVLQAADAPIASPYERSPQLGVRLGGQWGALNYAVETEYNSFTLPSGVLERAGRLPGQRLHLLGSLSLPFRPPGWWLVPRLSVNAASYESRALQAGPLSSHSRVIPSFSVDAGLELERRTRAFGRELQQTLEPRLLYVNTPYRAQSQFPVYDAAAKDFNFVSIFTDNAFSGVDRVSDAHQLTAGVTTRLVDTVSGAEALRLGLVQRYLFRSQRVTAQPDGTPDGAPLEQRLSDLLLLGSTSVVTNWTLDAALQYSPDISRSVRSIVSARYSPGPFRTFGATYRLARGLSEQLELGWQWPLWGQAAGASASTRRDKSANSCSGGWYSVGRVNYSIKDSRTTDSVLGLEYDSGCWIARVVAERLSTGRSEATTRLLLQLELVGLSRLGSNPLKVLKDNIPGYRLLRDERRTGTTADDWQP